MPNNILPLSASDLKNEGSCASSASKNNNAINTQQHKSFEFVIRFTNGSSKDLVIPINSIASLNDVSTKQIRGTIRNNNKELTKKRLKLIHNGKVLLDHTNFQKELRYLINRPVDDEDDEDGQDSNENEPIKIYIHCLIGDELSKEELAKEEELEHQPEKSTTEAPKGFDRLLSQGFSQQDIMELRRQFQEIHGSYLNHQSDDALRELEDRWIDSTVNNEIDEFPTGLTAPGTTGVLGTAGSDPTPGTAGTGGNGGATFARETDLHKELFIGVAIGYFLGVFALFLLSLEEDGFFNRRAKMAVVAGVIVNFSFGILKAWS